MKTLKAIKSALAILAATTACTPKEVPVVTHDKDVPVESVVYAPKGPAANAEAFSKLDLGAMSQRMSKAGSSEALLTLESLAPYMLFGRYIEDPHYSNSAKLRKALEMWNIALLKAEKTHASTVAEKGYFEKFARVVLSGCNSELKGCINIGFFRQDPNTARVLETMAVHTEKLIGNEKDTAKKDTLVQTYYRYLMVSFDLRNRVADQEFEFLYLNRARDYAEYFSRLPLESKERPAMQRHTEIFEMILNGFKPDLSNPAFKERVQKFVENFSPWNYSRTEPNPFGVGATKMLGLAARNFLYVSSDSGAQLSPSLVEAIKTSQAKASGDGEKAFDQIVAEFSGPHAFIGKALSLDASFPRDEYFFIVDRLFGDHLTPDDASEIWEGSRQDSARLLKTLEQYLKIQITWLIIETNRYMSDVYANKDGYASNTLVQNAVEKSYPISSRWQRTIAKINRLGIFVKRHMKRSVLTDDSPEFRRIDSILTSLGRNIKYISVYPNMMLMAYFMEKADGTLPLYTYWGKVDIDTVTIITQFFNGNVAPFFNFGNDSERLKRLETLYAFYFALKTDTFKAFNANGKNNVDEVRFFEKVIGKFLAENKKDLIDSKQSLVEDLSRSATHRPFMMICAEDRQALENRVLPGTTGTPFSIDFIKDFPYLTYMVGNNNGYGQSMFRFYNDSLGNKINEKMGTLRVKMVFVESMIRIFDNHLEKTGVSQEKRNEILNEIRKNIQSVKDVATEYITEIYRSHTDFSKCFNQTLKIEWDRQRRLVRMEETYLREAYRAIRLARDPSFTVPGSTDRILTIDEVKAKYAPTLPGDQLPEPVGAITTEALFYSQLDTMLRLRSFMKKLAPQVTIVLPPDLTDTQIWRDRRLSTIPATLSEDEFVMQGLNHFNGVGNSFVHWFSTNDSLKSINSRLKMLAEVTKLGEFEVFDWQNPSCAATQATDVLTCPKAKKRITPDDIVNEMAATIRLMSISENGTDKSDAQIMRLIGNQQRFDRSELQVFFLDDKTGLPRSLMETIYKLVATDPIALQEARDYYATASTLGHFLFTPDDSVANIMRQMYRPLLMNSFKLADEMEAAIHAREKKDKDSGASILELGYSLNNGRVNAIRPLKTADGTPIYIDPAKPEDVVATRKLFHDETRMFFMPQPCDPDYKGSETCKAGQGTK